MSDSNSNSNSNSDSASDSDSDSASDSDSDDSSEDENAFPDTQLESLPINIEAPQDKDPKVDKYDLEDYGHDSDEQNNAANPSTNGSNTPAKKFITAKERRLMKKNNVTEITDAIKEQQQLQQQQKQAKQKQTKQKQQAQSKPKVVAPPVSTRGRKGKAKKMKDKYADQDEEERQLRMELLAVSFELILLRVVVVNLTFICSQTRVLNLRVKKQSVMPKPRKRKQPWKKKEQPKRRLMKRQDYERSNRKKKNSTKRSILLRQKKVWTKRTQKTFAKCLKKKTLPCWKQMKLPICQYWIHLLLILCLKISFILPFLFVHRMQPFRNTNIRSSLLQAHLNEVKLLSRLNPFFSISMKLLRVKRN